MSIIYEALRKTQRNREVRSLPTRERVAARNLDWLDKLLVIFIVFLLIVISILYFPHVFKRHTASPKNVQAVVVKPQAVEAIVATPVPVVTKAPSNLILNGVLISSNEKVALINKKAFHVGDNVEGMRIISIEFDNVQLDDAGKLLTLRTAS